MRQAIPQNYQMSNMASPMRNAYDQRRSQYNFMSPQNGPRRTQDPRQMRSPQIQPTNVEEGQNFGKENVFKGAAPNPQAEWKRMERNSTGKVMDNNFAFNKYRDMMFSPQPASKTKSQNPMGFRSPQFNGKPQQSNQQPQGNTSNMNSLAQMYKNSQNQGFTNNGQVNQFNQNVNNDGNCGNIRAANKNSQCISPNYRQGRPSTNSQANQNAMIPQNNLINTQKNGYPTQAMNNQAIQPVDNNAASKTNSKYLKYKEQREQLISKNNQQSEYNNQTKNQNNAKTANGYPQQYTQDIAQANLYQNQNGNMQSYQQQQQEYYMNMNQSGQIQNQRGNPNNNNRMSQMPGQMKTSNYNTAQPMANPQKYSQSMNSEKWEQQKNAYLKNQVAPQKAPQNNQQGAQYQNNREQRTQRPTADQVQYQNQMQARMQVYSPQQRPTQNQAPSNFSANANAEAHVVKGKGFNTSQKPNFKSSKAKIDAMFQKAIERSQALTCKIESVKNSKAAVATTVIVNKPVTKNEIPEVKPFENNLPSKPESKPVSIQPSPRDPVPTKKEIKMTESRDFDQVSKPTQGRAIFKYEDGSQYEGEWVNGKREGFGILKSSTSVNIYSGDWDNDVYHGQGVLKNINVEQTTEPLHYQDLNKIGQFWTVFEGEFKEGKKEGLGTLSFSNGEKFNGKFENGVIEGEGTFQTIDGDFILGNWVKNVLEKTL